MASATRIVFYIVSIIDTAVNGRLTLWRLTKLPPKIQFKSAVDALDRENFPLHLVKTSRYAWFTLTTITIVLTTFLLAAVELYLQSGSFGGRLLGGRSSND